jgi:NDP-sugar pyrophosphorylase family protein
MILAAGQGTRLGQLGQRIPKVLIELNGRPLLARHLDWLEREGVKRVVVNAHHLADHVQAFVDGYRGPLELICMVEPELLGTAGGVRNALRYLEPGPFVVLYGDVLVDEPLGLLLERHRKERALATLSVHEASSAEGKGVVEVDTCGRVTNFVEKSERGEGPALINSGLYALEPELVAPLPAAAPLDFGLDVLPQAVARRERIFVHRLSSPAIDIGTPAGLAEARRKQEER